MVRDLAARWLQGEECDPAVFSGLLQTQARLFSLIGLKRRPREVGTPSLSEYLAQKAVPES
jgi:hypothetical protein